MVPPQGHGAEKTKVFFNDKKFEFESEQVPGTTLYQTFQVPAGNKLFLDVKAHNDPDKFIPSDSAPVQLKDGMHFYDLPPGTVG